MTLQFVQAKKTTLAVPITATETTEIKLKTLVDLYGNQLTMADFSDKGYITINPGGEREEIVSFTDFTVNSDGTVSIDTNITRGLKGKTPYDAGTGYAHSAGTVVIISNNPQIYNDLKEYIDGVAVAGSPDAGATDKGLVQIAVEAEVNANTRLGSTGAVLTVAPDVLATSKYGTLISSFTGVILPYGGATAPTGFLLCDGSAVSRTTYSTLFGVISTTYGAGNGSTTFNVPDLRSSMPLGAGTRVRTMTFDGASAVDPATDTITVESNDWLHTGQAVALTGSALPTGLSATTYYVIRIGATSIKLATSVANANAGTAVDITADGSGTCTLMQTLTARTVGQTGGEETHALTDAEMASHVHSISGLQTSNWSPNATNNSGPSGGGSLTTDSKGSDTPHNTLPPYTVVSYIIKH